MNKPLQNIVNMCQEDQLTKAREALTKTYDQHLKAINDLRTAIKKSMTEAVAAEDFEALDAQKVLLERTKAYADQLEGLQEAKPAKPKKKTDE